MREERQRSESTLKTEQGEASRLREEIENMRHQSQVQLDHAMRRYQELKESCAREEERLNKVIFDALTAVVHYKVRLQGACTRASKLCLNKHLVVLPGHNMPNQLIVITPTMASSRRIVREEWRL